MHGSARTVQLRPNTRARSSRDPDSDRTMRAREHSPPHNLLAWPPRPPPPQLRHDVLLHRPQRHRENSRLTALARARASTSASASAWRCDQPQSVRPPPASPGHVRHRHAPAVANRSAGGAPACGTASHRKRPPRGAKACEHTCEVEQGRRAEEGVDAACRWSECGRHVACLQRAIEAAVAT